MTKKSLIKRSSSFMSIRSIGSGEIKRVSSSSFGKIDGACNEGDCFFIVRNFNAFTSMFMHYNSSKNGTVSSSFPTTSIETKEEATMQGDSPSLHTGSNSSISDTLVGEDEIKVVYDSTTDLAYHNSSEKDGAKLIRLALTPKEESAMPDMFMPLRHYRAEKGDIDKAISAIKHTLKWRNEFQVDKIVAALEDDAKGISNENNDGEDFAAILRKENETGKIYVRGYDKDGRALMYMRPGRENTLHENNNMRHLVFQIEKAVACSEKNGHGKICLVIDYDGFSMSNTPSMSASKRTLQILQQHFCERMYRVYICNPPFVFRSFYAMIKPFVDPVTKQKVCWCVGKKGFDQLVDEVGGPEKAAMQLEKCCGGSDSVRDFDSVEYNNLPLSECFD